MKQTILIGADHAGFDLKNIIKNHLIEKGYDVEDFGADTLDPLDDFPKILGPLAYKISQNPALKGIVFGGSGQGEAIICNRYKGVRAAVYYGGNLEIVKLSREHNDANVLSIGARFVDNAKEAVDLWLATSFSNDEKYARRNKELDN
ncbi:MAG: RpiB/LacA/LacB family sugar-phosphate isomerase [Candidatus Pacebacteria bacterium]|jgi:ribose 5-phosphate isomerase B|nr:RpiB/LacA/LacB family sugar-phosphate isomerase [Candidatus Paceibacterota bacterium]